MQLGRSLATDGGKVVLTSLERVHYRFVALVCVDHPTGRPFDVFLVEGLSNQPRRGDDIDVEVEVVVLDKLPDFLFGGELTGGIVCHGMRQAIRRRRPCSFEDGIIPGVSSNGTVVDTVSKGRGSDGAAGEHGHLDRGLSDGSIHDGLNADDHGGDDSVWVGDDVCDVGSVDDGSDTFDSLVVSAISAHVRDRGELDGTSVGI